MDTFLISVIVPVYKAEQYLDECIKSIVNQTYKNLEIILVDDGSPDKCPQMCDEWSKKDTRIKVIHKANGGASSARNTGLNLAKGHYVGFVDSDDYIKEDMFEILLEALQGTDKKISCCLAYRVFEDGKIYKPANSNMKQKMNVTEALDALFYRKVGTAFWRRLFEHTVFDEIRFPEGEINEEFPLLVPITVMAEGMIFVDIPLYYHRERGGSVTSSIYLSASNAEILYKNLHIIQGQLQEYAFSHMISFRFFSAYCSYVLLISLEKNYHFLSENVRKSYCRYRKIMWNNLFFFLTSKYSKVKDKILYLLVATKLLRPIYKFLGKK